MERILRQKGLAEFRVAQLTVVVLIETGHEECNFVIVHLQAKVFETMDQVLYAGWACARLIKDSKGIY